MKYNTDDYRKFVGCRINDETAKSEYPLEFLKGEEDQFTVDHCPGLDVNTPYVNHVIEMMDAKELGYNFGEYRKATFAELDSMRLYRLALNRVEEIERKQRQQEESLLNG